MHKFKMQQFFFFTKTLKRWEKSVPLMKFTLGQRILKALINDFKTSFIKPCQMLKEDLEFPLLAENDST